MNGIKKLACGGVCAATLLVAAAVLTGSAFAGCRNNLRSMIIPAQTASITMNNSSRARRSERKKNFIFERCSEIIGLYSMSVLFALNYSPLSTLNSPLELARITQGRTLPSKNFPSKDFPSKAFSSIITH